MLRETTTLLRSDNGCFQQWEEIDDSFAKSHHRDHMMMYTVLPAGNGVFRYNPPKQPDFTGYHLVDE